MSSSTSSTSTAAPAASPAAAAAAAAAIAPIEILTTPESRFYANLHPILLLSIFIAAFRSLVADPLNTLLGLAPTVAILQAAYCVLCLPSSGNPSTAPAKPGQKKKKAAKPTQDLAAKIVPACLSFVLTIFLTAPVLYILLVLFGAPLVSHHAHTMLLALHLAFLTTPPLFYVHGLEASTWMRLASLQQPIDEIFGLALGACLGAWIGAIPIPLDWDRDWQRWPVTVLCGAYAGAVIGKLAGGYLFKGMKMKIN